MKRRMLSILLALVMCLSLLPATALAANDLSGHWAEDIVTQWQEKGWVSGYGDGSFRPDAPITRAAFAKLMNQAMGFTEEAAISFTDVGESDWYYHDVAKAVSAGYTQGGYGDGTFRPEKEITRAEAAVMIARATGLTAQESAADSFSDEISAWAKGSVGAVVAAGFMIGYTDGTFGADDTITRAAAVVALDRVAAKAQGSLTITEPGTSLEDKIIAGDLIVAESVGDGNVYLKNVTVVGDTYIKGGGSHSFYAENSRFSGTVYMQKDRLHMGLSGSTEMRQVQMEKPSSITFEKGFSGTVKSLNIPKDAPEGRYAIEAEDKTANPVESVSVDSKAELSLGANVSRVTVGENAKDASITVEKDTTVDNMEVNSKTEISGKGTVGSMDVGASGVTTDQDLTVKDTTTSNGAAAPSTKPSGNFSYISTGSSTTPTKPTVTITPDIINLQNTTDATFYADAAVTADDLKISVVKGGAVLENGTDYDLTISTGSANASIRISFKAALEKDISYQVTIEPSSVGAGKYSITKTTTELATPKTLVWNATSTGIESIIHNTVIPENGAKVTFTVTGATFNSDSGTIGAKLQANSSGAEEIFIDSSKITPTIGSNTITVSLDGKSLSVGDYTLTLSVDKNRLNLIVPYVADELSTTTATITVAAKPAALGDPSSSEPLEFTSGAALPTGGHAVSFPVTGIGSLSDEGRPTAIITPKVSGSPEASGITTDIYADSQPNNVQNVVVKLGGTAPTVNEDTEYTVTLTIPKEDINPATGYTVPESDLTQSFTFKVKPAQAPKVSASADYQYSTLVATEGASVSGEKIVLNITGASAVSTAGIRVVAYQGSTEADFQLGTVTFNAPTEGVTGALEINLTGVAPSLGSGSGVSRENGLKVVIPKGNFTPMAGYDVPSSDITVRDFKFVLNPAPASGGE